MRLIDHFVLTTKTLSAARTYYIKLGFSVAPDGVHPFGTHNANMYFRDGPMIETLSIHNHSSYAEAVGAGNTFVKNDAAFRSACGDEGFSHVVVTSTDADRDHAKFLAKSVSGGDVVSFSRQFEQPDGTMDTVAAKLAFATHPKAPYGLYFTCEDIVIPQIDRSLLLDHENGALGAKRVVSCSQSPLSYIEFLGDLIEPNKARYDERGVDCDFPNGCASIITPARLEDEFGVTHHFPGESLQHSGLVFEVIDLQKTTALLTRNQISFECHNNRVVIQPGTETSPFFAFEQHD